MYTRHQYRISTQSLYELCADSRCSMAIIAVVLLAVPFDSHTWFQNASNHAPSSPWRLAMPLALFPYSAVCYNVRHSDDHASNKCVKILMLQVDLFRCIQNVSNLEESAVLWIGVMVRCLVEQSLVRRKDRLRTKVFNAHRQIQDCICSFPWLAIPQYSHT